MTAAGPAGILLAGGAGVRFGGGKLLAPLADGTPVGVAACRALASVLPSPIVVVRPGDDELARLLEAAGARIVRCDRAHEGMGSSLACAVAASRDARGWIVALADMPWLAPATIRAVAEAIAAGASVAAPFTGGRRGHPVGFAASHRDALLALRGDEGARAIVAGKGHALVRLAIDDPGAFADVDTPGDLRP